MSDPDPNARWYAMSARSALREQQAHANRVRPNAPLDHIMREDAQAAFLEANAEDWEWEQEAALDAADEA